MKKLIIAGKGIGYEEAPENKSLEIWGVNDYFLVKPHCTMVWEMHDFTWTVEDLIRHRVAVIGERESAPKTYVRCLNHHAYFKLKAEKINEHKIPLMTSGGIYDEKNPVQGIPIPTSMEYPLAEVIHKVASSRPYLIGTIAYMLAYAILINKWKHIELYGCNLEAGEEWAYQRPCVEYYVGIAEGRGMKVDIIGSMGKVLTSPGDMLYGYLGTYPDMRPKEKDLTMLPEVSKPTKLWYPLGKKLR